MVEVNRENRDIVLSPEKYVYLQEGSKGLIKTFVGPCVVSQTGQDTPVSYDPQRDSYDAQADLHSAVRKRPVAVQRDYMVLFNPAKDGSHPEPGTMGRQAPELDFGRKINVPGPCEFALWPGQAAVRIPGHHLRSNQYLLVKIYDAEEARRNWDQAVVETKTDDPADDGDGKGKGDDPKAPKAPKEPKKTPQISTCPKDLAVGKLYIVKGTEVSFYIPPTGVSVVQEGMTGEFVRDALTLERLEYAILVDEDGNKVYPKGPSVVFPKPTQKFVADKRGNIKFRAIELNELQGIHIKVIAPYTDDDGKPHEVGKELFIKGDKTPIYYPREEHSLIAYDGKSKHFATAVPAGEGRYVMDRMSGKIHTDVGPSMLLPDPRSQVIVRRVLTETQCRLWYPGNDTVLEYNDHLRELLSRAPTTRSGAVSEGDFERGSRGKRAAKFSNAAANAMMEKSLTSAYAAEASHFVADEFTRSSTYSDPRTVTLDTKLQGVPTINVWTGYAVQVVDKQGGRRVVEGPGTILLGYDEELEAMALSTGKPKTTDTLYHTPYLRVANNKVSDIITAETSDHVGVVIKVSYRVDFTGDSAKWFSVENYVKFLCDHIRSVLKGAVQKMPISEFYAKSVDMVRDLVLGAKAKDSDRPGMLFEENGMLVRDVDVLKVNIPDDKIHKLLSESQHKAVSTNIELQAARRELQASKEKEGINQAHIDLHVETALKKITAQALVNLEEHKVAVAAIQSDVEKQAEKMEVTKAAEAITNFKAEADLARRASEEEQAHRFQDMEAERRKGMIAAEAKAAIERMSAAQEGFSEALIAISRDETAVKVAGALNAERIISGGEGLGQALAAVFAGAPHLIERITGNGEKKHKAALSGARTQ